MSFPFIKILKSELFRNSEILAGISGIDKQVESYSLLYDANYNYLKRNAFVIITGADWLAEKSRRMELLSKLHDIEAAGIGLYLIDFPGEIPEDIISGANEIDLPIVSIPETVSCQEILTFFSTNIFVKLLDKFIGIDRIQRDFYDCRKATKFDCIANKLWRYTGNEVFIRFSDKVYHYGKRTDLDKLIEHQSEWKLVEDLETKDSSLTDLKCFKLDMDGNTHTFVAYVTYESGNIKDMFCYFIGANHSLTDYDTLLLNYAWQALYTEMNLAISTLAKSYEKLIKQLLEVSFTDYDQAKSACLKTGCQLPAKMSAVALPVTIPGKRFQETLSTIKSVLMQQKSQDKLVLIGNYHDNFILLFSDTEGIACIVREVISALKTELFPDSSLVGGISSLTDWNTLASGYREAQSSLFWAGQLPQQIVVHYTDLGFLQLVTEQDSLLRIRDFIQKFLGSIRDYDDLNQTELYHTLRIYVVDSLWRSSHASKIMFTSVNTVRYRIKQIENLTGLDLSDFKTRVSIEIALELESFLQSAQ